MYKRQVLTIVLIDWHLDAGYAKGTVVTVVVTTALIGQLRNYLAGTVQYSSSLPVQYSTAVLYPMSLEYLSFVFDATYSTLNSLRYSTMLITV